MESVMQKIEAKHKKASVVDVRSGDNVRVHQKVKEGAKERVQIFEGLVIRVSKKGSLTSNITVRRIASGVGVEKTFLLHSPSILKVEVTKRSKVRRNYLTYMRNLTGKSARLTGTDFDKEAVNAVHDEVAEAEEAKLHEAAEANYDVEAAKKAKEEEKAEAKAQEALAAHAEKAAEASATPEEK
jgi:large subunit ribosomal protein L19